MVSAYQPGGPGQSYSSPVFNYSSVAGGFQGMLKAFQDAYSQANQVNEQRYRDILGGYRDLGASQEAELGRLGTQRTTDIAQDFTNQASKARQDLIGSGLGGSTIMPGVLGGIARQGAYAQSDWLDQLTRLRLGTNAQNAGNALSFMERRNDQMPDLSMLASLASAYGAGGGGLPRYQYQPQSISTQGYRMPGLGSFMGAFPMQTRAAQRINGGYAGFIA
jgi:hypothetical protein